MYITCVTFDCADPPLLVDFWAQALGWTVDHVGANGATCRPPTGDLYFEFVRVPEAKSVKNRVHVGTDTDDIDAEIARLVGLGAIVAWEEEFPDRWTYRNVVLRDPEGNEFCLGTAPGT